MVSVSELLVNFVMSGKSGRYYIHSTQNGKRSVNPLHGRITRTEAPPVDETEPNLLVVIYVKQGKPVFLLFFYRKAFRKENR